MHGHDISHYLCDTENFRGDRPIQDLQEEDTLVLIPDENDVFSYNHLFPQLWEIHNVESHPVGTLFSKVVDVPQRRELSSNNRVRVLPTFVSGRLRKRNGGSGKVHGWVPEVELLKSEQIYYESRKRDLMTKSTYECRCDERPKTKSEKSMHTPLIQ